MTRRNIPRMCGVSEASEMLGIKKSNLQQTKDFPKPAQVLKSGPIWLEDDIVKFRRIKMCKKNKDEGESEDG